ncbi:hypothetical protein A6A06_25935 [Streptomyces sp. CB02923]|nr:hypothetical protein A6A06_25935 [Streptomyces sp. CB02923]
MQKDQVGWSMLEPPQAVQAGQLSAPTARASYHKPMASASGADHWSPQAQSACRQPASSNAEAAAETACTGTSGPVARVSSAATASRKVRMIAAGERAVAVAYQRRSPVGESCSGQSPVVSPLRPCSWCMASPPSSPTLPTWRALKQYGADCPSTAASSAQAVS